MHPNTTLRHIFAGFCLALCCSCACGHPADIQQAANTHRAQPPVSAEMCRAQPFLRTELFFGLTMQRADGTDVAISEQQWQNFLDTCVTPRFPDGLTVLNSYGQWRHDERIVREKSKVLVLLYPLSADGRSGAEPTAFNRKVEEIRASYKHRFHQDSVMRVTTPVRVSF